MVFLQTISSNFISQGESVNTLGCPLLIWRNRDFTQNCTQNCMKPRNTTNGGEFFILFKFIASLGMVGD